MAGTVADADGDRATVKGINNMRLQNTVMQLRKACSHPLLFSEPTEPLPETTEELVDASGKMMLLERLLDELFRTKHKVLLFSQFTTMLDIIEVRVLGISPSAHRCSCIRTDDRRGRRKSRGGGFAVSTDRRARWSVAST